MLNKVRIYIKPFDDSGGYGDWIEITDDVELQAVGAIAQNLDNTEYDIGVYRNSNFTLTLRNEHGAYSDVGGSQSIFHFKRSGSLVRATWEINDAGGPICGIALTDDAILSEEIDVFVGLLNDEGLAMDVSTQKVTFPVLGRESIFQKALVPFTAIANGDLLSEVILALLDQLEITNLLTVSAANINLGLDQEIDAVASLENKTVQEALNGLLLASNSVLYISGDSVIVSPRTASAAVQLELYGQGSSSGSENTVNIAAVKTGLAKTFNFFVWDGTTTIAQDTTSSDKYGVRKKIVSFEFFTDTTKRQNILDALLAEFKDPKQEFDVSTPLDYTSIAVELLGRMTLDYPKVYVPGEFPFPICGLAVCGEFVLPKALWAFEVSPLDPFKAIGRSVDLKTSIVKFKARAI